MSERIAVVDPQWPAYTERLGQMGVSALGFAHPRDVQPDQAPAIQVLISRPDLGADLVHALPRLQWIQSTWAGIEPLLAVNPPVRLTITRAVDVFGPAMREFVFGHLLAWAQRVTERTGARSWDPALPKALAGTRIGIMGAGSIGCAIAATAKHFGLHVVGLSRTGAARDPFESIYPVSELSAFAENLNHLVVALPSTVATRHLVTREVLDLLQPGATVINVGRGSTVDEEAVVAALGTGRLALAVLDVFEREPLDTSSHLWRIPNLIITSHTAAATHPADIINLFLDNLARWRSGSPLRGVVDVGRGY